MPINKTQVNQLISETEVAKALAVSVRTVQRWRVNGDGPPFVKNACGSGRSGAVRYSIDDLNAWIASLRRQSTSEAGGQNVD